MVSKTPYNSASESTPYKEGMVAEISTKQADRTIHVVKSFNFRPSNPKQASPIQGFLGIEVAIRKIRKTQMSQTDTGLVITSVLEPTQKYQLRWFIQPCILGDPENFQHLYDPDYYLVDSCTLFKDKDAYQAHWTSIENLVLDRVQQVRDVANLICGYARSPQPSAPISDLDKSAFLTTFTTTLNDGWYQDTVLKKYIPDARAQNKQAQSS